MAKAAFPTLGATTISQDIFFTEGNEGNEVRKIGATIFAGKGNTSVLMSGFNRPSGGNNTKESPKETIRFYQQIGFFVGANPTTIVECYTDDHRKPPNPRNPWHDVLLFHYTEDEVWIGDPEADVCAQNKVYTKVLPKWGHISHGAFVPTNISEPHSRSSRCSVSQRSE